MIMNPKTPLSLMGGEKKPLVLKDRVPRSSKTPPSPASSGPSKGSPPLRPLQDMEACMEHLVEEVGRLSFMILEIQSVAEAKKLQ